MNKLHIPLRLNEENGEILDARGFCVAEGCTDNGQLRQIIDGVNRAAELDAACQRLVAENVKLNEWNDRLNKQVNVLSELANEGEVR